MDFSLMNRLVLAACLLVPSISRAQKPEPPPPRMVLPSAAPIGQQNDGPEMVLLPRAIAEMAARWIRAPDPTSAVQLYGVLLACLEANPQNGVVHRMGEDQCPTVTAALAARAAAKPQTPTNSDK